MRLIEQASSTPTYHEHYSYLSLTAVSASSPPTACAVFDVEELPTHGGSLRVFAPAQRHRHAARQSAAWRAAAARSARRHAHCATYYASFQAAPSG